MTSFWSGYISILTFGTFVALFVADFQPPVRVKRTGTTDEDHGPFLRRY